MKKIPALQNSIQLVNENTTTHANELPAVPFNETLLKKIFFLSLLVMLLLTWGFGFNVGFHQDEIDMNNYGKACYSYYATGGKDKSFMIDNRAVTGLDSFIKYYGTGFEVFAQGAKMVSGNTEGKKVFNVRHFVNELFAIIALLYAGLVARKLFDWRVAIVTAWLLFFSPSFFGHAFFNTKDIPFCAGYIATMYYVLCFLDELPVISWKTAVKLMLAFAFTTDVRIGGILWIFFLFAFTALYMLTKPGLVKETLQNLSTLLLKYAVVIVGGLSIVVVLWPFLLMNPLRNLFIAIGIIQKYPMKININFGGQTINSLELPWYYVPKLLSITTPVFILVLAAAGLLFSAIKFKKINRNGVILLLVACLFPLVYAIVSRSVVYTGWRHFLFIYPAIGIMAAFGFIAVTDLLQNKMIKMALCVFACLALWHPVTWSIKNHPYEYCYFNEISGGFKNNYTNYDTDYWQITMKNAMDRMMAKEPVAAARDTVIVATNIPFIVRYYMKTYYPGYKVKVIESGCTLRNYQKWDYAIYNTFLIKPDYLENYFPPKTMLYSENIDGLPVTVVLKDTARLDVSAFEALKISQYKIADSLYTAHLNNTHDDNPALDADVALAKAYVGQNDAAIKYAGKELDYHISGALDYNAHCALGIAHFNMKKFDLSIAELNTAIAILPQETFGKDILKQVQAITAHKQ